MRTTMAILLIGLCSSVAFAAVPRTEPQDYIALGGDVAAICLGATEGEEIVHLGGGCFTLDGSESTVTMTIEDTTGLPTGGYYSFTDADVEGNVIAEGAFCASISTGVPAGAVNLFVQVEQVNSSFDCPAGGGPGTVGTVTASFE
jgi:hypothetical protein